MKGAAWTIVMTQVGRNRSKPRTTRSHLFTGYDTVVKLRDRNQGNVLPPRT
jgi:hypothetical protein